MKEEGWCKAPLSSNLCVLFLKVRQVIWNHGIDAESLLDHSSIKQYSMFGKQQQQQRPGKEFDVNDLDKLLNANIEEDENVDLNDPELLVKWVNEAEIGSI